MKHPTTEECLKLLEEYGTPTRVKGHCRAVADTACRIGRALNRHGHHFDLELVNAAGLLHDIARVKEHHWDVGADFAEKTGLCSGSSHHPGPYDLFSIPSDNAGDGNRSGMPGGQAGKGRSICRDR